MKTGAQGRDASSQTGVAFTLMEVMIAVAIFFGAMFAILAILSSGLHAAGLLRSNAPTAGMAIWDLTLTNKLEEGSEDGNFGPVYPDFGWERRITEYATNGLFKVDITVYRTVDRVTQPYSTLSVLLFKPDSPHKS